jgi:phosphate acetyltransferase
MDLIENLRNLARKNLKVIVLPEGTEPRVIAAAAQMRADKIAEPILLGEENRIREIATSEGVNLGEITLIDPSRHDRRTEFTEKYYELRKHKGITIDEAGKTIQDPLYFAAMMLRENMAAGAVAGSVNTTGDVLRAAIQIVGLQPDIEVVSSCFLMVLPQGKVLTFADCAVIPDPTAENLASIAISSANTHQKLAGSDPKIAMLSFSTKGSAKHPLVEKVVKATELIENMKPSLKVDGELQFDAAFLPEVGKRKAPDSAVAGQANVFIFPDLNAANIGYKMVERLAGATAVGPVIQGLAKPYNDLSRGCSVADIINVAAICSILSD